MFFQYDEKAVEYLKAKDAKLGEVIDQIGYIEREVDTDLFSSVVHQIVGQQISMKAMATIWNRLQEKCGEITPEKLYTISAEELQSIGISFRKADYIKDFARKVYEGEFDLDAVVQMSDEEVIKALSSLKGIGIWTAEMLLLFCLQRQDVLSFGDLAIQRGMRMLYHHREITPKLFAKYRRRYSPYGSVASLYLWAISGGAIEGMKDYAPKKSKKK